jgi:hypothetical protein
MKKFSHFLRDEQPSLLQETFLGKTATVLQQRKHEAAKKMLLQKLAEVQRECRDGIQTREPEGKLNVILKALFHLASALKSSPEMSSATLNAVVIQYLFNDKQKK